MTSSLTLEKLRVPLEKEKESLQKAKDAILEHLKILQVSISTISGLLGESAKYRGM